MRDAQFFKNEYMQLHYRLQNDLKEGEEQAYKEGVAQAAGEILGIEIDVPEDDSEDEHGDV